MQIKAYFLRKKKNIIHSSSAEIARGVVRVNSVLSEYTINP